jgi:MurNAc alpha-1-phosphate uridylyltransferase
MKAIILAAGRGERMRPLTDNCPKPLLKVAGIPLIVHHIKRLAKCGITDIVINYAWLGKMIVEHLGDGKQFGVKITYSPEEKGGLETAGGIIQALPLLDKNNDNEPFLLVNGDVYTDFDFANLTTLKRGNLAHIYLVKNPEHNTEGDFIFDNQQLTNISSLQKTQVAAGKSFTFSGLSIFRPEFFKNLDQGKSLKLGPLLKSAIDKNKVSANLFTGLWTDVGTPERLTTLNQLITAMERN